ncbi:AraC family ligand binding domain-containing protein [Salana multivorans]
MHQHREHELIWDVSGTLSVTMAGRLWLVPPGAGLWVPSGTEHEVAASVWRTFACTFVEPQSTPRRGRSPASSRSTRSPPRRCARTASSTSPSRCATASLTWRSACSRRRRRC